MKIGHLFTDWVGHFCWQIGLMEVASVVDRENSQGVDWISMPAFHNGSYYDGDVVCQAALVRYSSTFAHLLEKTFIHQALCLHLPLFLTPSWKPQSQRLRSQNPRTSFKTSDQIMNKLCSEAADQATLAAENAEPSVFLVSSMARSFCFQCCNISWIELCIEMATPRWILSQPISCGFPAFRPLRAFQ